LLLLTSSLGLLSVPVALLAANYHQPIVADILRVQAALLYLATPGFQSHCPQPFCRGRWSFPAACACQHPRLYRPREHRAWGAASSRAGVWTLCSRLSCSSPSVRSAERSRRTRSSGRASIFAGAGNIALSGPGSWPAGQLSGSRRPGRFVASPADISHRCRQARIYTTSLFLPRSSSEFVPPLTRSPSPPTRISMTTHAVSTASQSQCAEVINDRRPALLTAWPRRDR